MDEETATFFTQVDNAIKKLRDGKEDKCPGVELGYQDPFHTAFPRGLFDGGQGCFLEEQCVTVLRCIL